MDPLERKRVGHTSLLVTRLGIGGAPLGNEYRSVTDMEVDATITEAIGRGIRYIDTAPLYGRGRSESRLGRYFATHRKPADLVLSTKVGRILRQEGGAGDQAPLYDYSEEGVRKSFESSLQRLGPDMTIDILYIHDPDEHYQEAISQAYKALAELRATGRVKAIGAGMNQWEMELRFAREGDFDCFLQAGKYTLLDQSADEKFLPYCQEKGIGVIIGAPFGYGVLATDLRHGARPVVSVPAATLERALEIDAVCARHDVPLRAAALQFILAHPAITSVIPGSQTKEEMHENFEMIQYDIPGELWDDLKQEKLIMETAPTP
ncbi:MAG: aldo/keto reductase [Thaumarchaeota archaeon]|nr:aldo/keto reductase [Nitrososphaerota archaeon]